MLHAACCMLHAACCVPHATRAGPPPTQALQEPQWINCDVRHFDCSILGKFGVIMTDPPWRIRQVRGAARRVRPPPPQLPVYFAGLRF
jgi:hypothetical protein